ncbi:MAG: hypothetical protein O7E56_02235 [SAR324 cluster bacterium]|nr:hypothetical protein [SAR324 cluster bacterium]
MDPANQRRHRPKTPSIPFPSPRREFRRQRLARISVRTAHLIAIALLKGVVALGHAPLNLPGAFRGTALTGMVYVGIEPYKPGIFIVPV